MTKHGYANGRYAEGYYKTLINAASFFARSEEASKILKDVNENKKLQNVNDKCKF
jgi:hypothetical protein